MTFPHTATVQRKTKVGTLYSFASVGTVKCFVQPIDNESAQAYGMSFTKSLFCYVPLASDVVDHDRLVVDGITYGVAGIRNHNYGSLAHKRLALEQL